MTGVYQPKEQRAAKQRETRTANFSIGSLPEGAEQFKPKTTAQENFAGVISFEANH
jgi:hypothetical protein